MRKLIYITLLIAVIIITGCSSVAKTGEMQNTPSPITQQSATQDIKKGIVTGRIITDSPQDRVGLIVYLGDIIVDSKGYTGGFLDKQKAPSDLVNGETGVFTINNVPPGQYSLIIYEVVLGGRAYTDDTGNVMVVKVEPGKTVDLGDINFSGF
jgi:uncharacterized protein YceK